MIQTCNYFLLEIKLSPAKSLLILLFALLMNTVSIATADHEAGIRFFNKGDYEEAIRQFSQENTPLANFSIGLVYEKGLQKYREALIWYKKAAQKGYVDAQYQIWDLYNTLSSKKIFDLCDHREADKWKQAAKKGYWKLASKGDERAMYRLSVLYDPGIGILGTDKEISIGWLRKAAERNYPKALGSLGFLYILGDGVPKDATQAEKYYLRAAELGDDFAQLEIGKMYSGRLGIKENYTLSYMWLSIAGENGYDVTNYLENVKAKMSKWEIDKAEKLIKEWKARNNKAK